ncbi:MAG TPA: RepB family plasmid replication initiator protein [Victivallales bacterium]|nr:RepB family plasmid replication initiator protein [Victivallales bacterium]
MNKKHNKFELGFAPKKFLAGPLFASTPQKEGRKVVIKKEVWVVGGIDSSGEKKYISKPALDIRHGILIFLLLSIHGMENMYQWNKPLNISFKKLAMLFSGGNGSRDITKVKIILEDLQETYVSIIGTNITGNVGKAESVTFRIIENFTTFNYNGYNRLENIKFHPVFIDKFLNIENLMLFKLSTLLKLKSRLSQAIYTYIPSRAFHRGKQNPFHITLKKLLEQAANFAPSTKSKRKEKVKRDGTTFDIINELDGAPMTRGQLRVEMCETVDKSDYLLNFWSEFNNFTPSGPLWDAWKLTGGTVREWTKRLSRRCHLEFNGYDINALSYIPNWDSKHLVFIEKVYCLIGQNYFSETIGDCKNAIIEDRGIVNSEKYLISALMNAVRKTNK